MAFDPSFAYHMPNKANRVSAASSVFRLNFFFANDRKVIVDRPTVPMHHGAMLIRSKQLTLRRRTGEHSNQAGKVSVDPRPKPEGAADHGSASSHQIACRRCAGRMSCKSCHRQFGQPALCKSSWASVSQLCANPAELGSKLVYGVNPEFLFGPIGFVVATNWTIIDGYRWLWPCSFVQNQNAWPWQHCRNRSWLLAKTSFSPAPRVCCSR